jgi:hypothetical protein
MTVHAKNALRCTRISQILDFPLTIPAFETVRAEGLVSGQDRKVLDFVATIAAAIGTVVAYQGAITEE